MNEKERDGLVFYKSHYQAIKDLNDEQLGKLFRAVFEKQLGNEVVLADDIKIAFNFINNQLVVDEKKYNEKCERARANGKRGGAPKGNTNASKQPKQPKTTKTSLKEKDNEKEKEKEKDKDKDNIYTLSEAKASTSGVAKASKKKYGEYKHVLLKDEELQRLKEDYENWEELIQQLDEYIEMKGYKAKSHYLAIKKWVVDAVEKHPKRQAQETKKDSNSDFWEQMIKEYDGGSNNDNE